MMKRAAMFLIVVPAALPLAVVPAWAIATGAAVSAALLGIGARWASIPFATAGATVTLITYTVALRLAGRPPDGLTATALGVALVLALEIVGFERRTGAAGIDPAVIRGQVRHWTSHALGGAAACLGLAAAATVVTLALPPAAAPVAVAAGVLVAFGAVVWALAHGDSVEGSPHEDPGDR